jgi:hypothetical protein
MLYDWSAKITGCLAQGKLAALLQRMRQNHPRGKNKLSCARYCAIPGAKTRAPFLERPIKRPRVHHFVNHHKFYFLLFILYVFGMIDVDIFTNILDQIYKI